jgi:CDP-diacylglycerol--glycerol-3-phosphate 3-phosphatidyltransferase
VVLIIGREFAVTALRMVALENDLPIAANAWGKAKTVSQIVAVSILILGTHLGPWMPLGRIALWVALVLTVWSMLVYFWQNRSVIAGDAA